MCDAHLKTGHDYTVTVALLAIAFVFSPVMLFGSRPIGYWSFSFALVSSVERRDLGLGSLEEILTTLHPPIALDTRAPK